MPTRKTRTEETHTTDEGVVLHIVPPRVYVGRGDVWTVWVSLQAGDPTAQSESFVVGEGDSRIAAVRAAKRALREVYAALEAEERMSEAGTRRGGVNA